MLASKQASAAITSGNRAIRVGIIGLGDVSAAHARAIHETAGMELVACADNKPGRAREWAANEGHGCRPFASLREMATAMTGELDAVIASVPDRYHADVAIEAMREFGLWVLVEKPPTETLADAQALVAASLETRRPLLCGTVYVHGHPQLDDWHVTDQALGFRFEGHAQWLRRRGQVWWRPGPSDPFGDQGVHLLALLGDIFGWPKPVRLKGSEWNAVGREATINVGVFDNPEIGVRRLNPAQFQGVDNSRLVIDFPGPVQWTVWTSVLGNYETSEAIQAEVFGARSSLRIPIVTGEVDPALHLPKMFNEDHGILGNWVGRQPRPPRIDQVFRLQAQHWQNVIRRGERPRVGGSEILWLMGIIEKYRKSVAAGGIELTF
jgi:predicted dehydrogenase